MYRYKVKDDDGDISVVKFDFDHELGRLVMESEPKQLISIRGYQIPSSSEMESLFQEFCDTGGELEPDEDMGILHHTLFVMLVDEWCDTPSKVHEAENAFEASLKIAYTTLAMNAMIKASDTDMDDVKLPVIRTDNVSFLWDTFVYIKEQGEEINSSPEKRREAEEYIKNEVGDNNFTFDAVLPKAIGYWAMPIKIYEDQDFIISRVPYEVMEDLYDEWKKYHSGTSYDGSALDGLPINITNEINALFDKFNKKQ